MLYRLITIVLGVKKKRDWFDKWMKHIKEWIRLNIIFEIYGMDKTQLMDKKDWMDEIYWMKRTCWMYETSWMNEIYWMNAMHEWAGPGLGNRWDLVPNSLQLGLQKPMYVQNYWLVKISID